MASTALFDPLAVYPPGSPEPTLLAVLNTLTVLPSVLWATHSFRRAQAEPGRGGPWHGRSPIMLTVGVGWVLFAAQSAATATYAGLVARCDFPYVHRYLVRSAHCEARVFLLLRDILMPISVCVFVLGSTSRFLHTVKALADRAAEIFMKVAQVLTFLCVLTKLVAVTWHWTTVAGDPPVVQDQELPAIFLQRTDLLVFSICGALDLVSIIFGFRYIHSVLSEADKAVNHAWSAKDSAGGGAPVAQLKAKQRRLVLFAACMLATNCAMIGAFGVIKTGDMLLQRGVPALWVMLAYHYLLAAFGYCEMFAISAMASAVRANNEAASLMNSRESSALVAGPTTATLKPRKSNIE